MTVPPIDPEQFVASVAPHLARQDPQALLALLKSDYSDEQITGLFTSDNADARKVAALSFGLVGRTCCVHKLVPLLKDPDPMVHQMAEHALWSVWLRSGSCAANHEVCRGTRALNRRDYEHAVQHFDRAIELDPDFAEAYNQRAIVEYLVERYEDSIEDCRRAVARMPCHFGAWAGMGHCYADLGRFAEAIESYERALELNPRLDGMRQLIQSLRDKLTDR